MELSYHERFFSRVYDGGLAPCEADEEHPQLSRQFHGQGRGRAHCGEIGYPCPGSLGNHLEAYPSGEKEKGAIKRDSPHQRLAHCLVEGVVASDVFLDDGRLRDNPSLLDLCQDRGMGPTSPAEIVLPDTHELL